MANGLPVHRIIVTLITQRCGGDDEDSCQVTLVARSGHRPQAAGEDLIIADGQSADAAVVHLREFEAVIEEVKDGAAFDDAAEGDFVDAAFVILRYNLVSRLYHLINRL